MVISKEEAAKLSINEETIVNHLIIFIDMYLKENYIKGEQVEIPGEMLRGKIPDNYTSLYSLRIINELVRRYQSEEAGWTIDVLPSNDINIIESLIFS